jgi:hypothetical protein
MVGYVDDSNGQTNRFNADEQPKDDDLLHEMHNRMHNGGTIYYEHLEER